MERQTIKKKLTSNASLYTQKHSVVGNIPQRVVKVKKIILPAEVVQMLDSAIHRLDHYPVDNTIIGFCTTYPLDSELSGG